MFSMTNMKRPYTFWLEDEDKEALRQRAYEMRVTTSEAVRQALTRFLSDEEKPQQEQPAD